MNNKELYRFLVRESRCSRQKRFCKNRCNDCPLFTSESKSTRYYDELINHLKGHDPELHFINELDALKTILEQELHHE